MGLLRLIAGGLAITIALGTAATSPPISRG